MKSNSLKQMGAAILSSYPDFDHDQMENRN